jgi:cytochrome c oxidase subunit 3
MVEAADAGMHVHHSEEAHLLDPKLPPNTHRFFAIYYIMTGLHGIHVLIGVGVISWLLVMAMRGRFSSDYYTPVDLVGLYWHVVDLVWIFLFPLFYLIH